MHVAGGPGSLATAAAALQVIKTEDQAWDAAAIYALLTNLAPDVKTGSCDADAVQTAAALLNASAARAEKRMFVITDGYGSQGKPLPRLSATLQCILGLHCAPNSNTLLQELQS